MWLCGFPRRASESKDEPQPQTRPRVARSHEARDRVSPSRSSNSEASGIVSPTAPIFNTVQLSALYESSRPSVTTSALSATPRPASAGRPRSASSPQVVWVVPQGPMQRLNIADGAPVSPDFISGLDPGREVDNNLLESQDRLWRRLYGVKLSLCVVTQHVGYVRHHLRGGDQHSHHHEIWRMFLIHAPAKEGAWLWPVGRESDFENLENLDLFMVRFTTFKDGVVWLDLSHQQLTALPPGLADMTGLHRLELHCNRLTCVTSDIATLTALDYLSLHRNHISYVSPRLAQLSRLRWLSLNANALTEVPELPVSVERLSLHMNGIGSLLGAAGRTECSKSGSRGCVGDGGGASRSQGAGAGTSKCVRDCGEESKGDSGGGGSCSNAKGGDREGAGCVGAGPSSGINGGVAASTNLREGGPDAGCSERLPPNRSGDVSATALPCAGSHETQLPNLISEAATHQQPSPPAQLPQLPQLAPLEPRQQGLEGGPLSRCTRLIVLSLFTNSVSCLPVSAVLAWRRVNRLALQRNQLLEVPEEIGELAELEDLWLYGNRLNRLPDALGRLPKLRKLWANDNCLTYVPASLSNCAVLQELFLGRNQLQQLPTEELVAGCASLVRLQVAGNPALDTSSWPAGLLDILV